MINDHPDSPVNEFRQDPITGQKVIISSGRDQRPNQFSQPAEAKIQTDDKLAASCPFCAGQMQTPPIVARYGGSDTDPDSWDVCVVPNLYPVLEQSTDLESDDNIAKGIHEVVIESATHATQVSDLTPRHLRLMVEAYRDRFVAMSKEGSITFGLAMKNSGRDAGASLHHTHSQVFGLPFVPEQMVRELSGSERYFAKRKSCVYCDLIKKAKDASLGESRIVGENNHFIAWCPEASRFAYEVWIAPKAHYCRFEHASDDLISALASLLHPVIGKLDQHDRIDAFNHLVHSLPFDSNRDDQYHWHIEILPRIARQAGFEWGTGVFINTVPPTQAASELRLSISN